MASFKKRYGANWKSVYYATANKRTGGLKGKNRGLRSANKAFAKGSHSKSKSGSKRRGRKRG
jgi:hypothetical protein